ncbi:glycosyltransferase, partial [Candidatus Parcubacteria bacterium]|nr:glycosyltransferase [Candidatus Parcubacteria bacterium]
DPYIKFLSREESRMELFKRIGKSAEHIVGTIANFYPAKNLETFIDAAALVKQDDTIFCIIGGGAQRQKLESIIKRKNLEDKVILLGKIPNAAQYLPGLDLFVLSSSKEGFPWSVLEAMVAKLPVIATKVGAVPEIIEDGKNGYSVNVGDSSTIAQRIEELLSNELLRQQLGIQAHQTVLFKFNIDTMVREFEALL